MPQPLPPAVPPLLLDQRYELGATIGSGGMGTVFRARDKLSGESVAIKQLRGDAIARDRTLIERFAREHAALRTLNHPNIVRVIEAFEGDGNQYLVMEYLAGGSLDHLLGTDREPLPVERVLRIALDLVDALTRVHRLDIVHRDIKPSNVLLAPDGTPRLSDFGVAQLGGYDALTVPNAVVGTLDYLCPEALAGRRLDARADLWGVGTLLFEMLTQRRPFGGDHPAAVLLAIVSAPPLDIEVLCPQCPAELTDLVYRLLDKDPAQRVPSARQLAAELERIFHGLGAGSRALPPCIPSKTSAAAEPLNGSDTTHLRAHKTRGLPAELTPFIGRDAELQAITHLLAHPLTRLVTIRAPGGMGKSRLAREVGRHLAFGGDDDRTLPNVAWVPVRVELVELAALDSADLIVPAIASVVGLVFSAGASQKEQLLRYLERERLVLILDNFEHLLSGASFLAEVHSAAPGVQVLATSRESLGLSHEHLFELHGLIGTQLFLACAHRVRLNFELTPDHADAVTRICELVAGMPLGITLAAAWVNALEPTEIADEIERNFEFLAVELRDLPERHHSLQAVFEHSWNLLTSEERRVFAALSVFRGGFTRSAAQAGTAASLRTLAALLNKSLVVRDPASGRYSMHELLRQYAANQLARDPRVEDIALNGHSGYYTALLASMHPQLTGASAAVACDNLTGELDNVRTAWAREVEQRNFDQLGCAIDALCIFYSSNGHFAEAATVFGSAAQALACELPTPGSEAARIVGLLRIHEAQAYHAQWREPEALHPATQALEFLNEHPRERAFGLFTHAIVRHWLAISFGGPGASLETAEQALKLYRTTNDWWGTARALIAFGDLVDPIRGETCFLESTALQRSNGDQAIVLPGSVIGLGIIKQERGDRAQGRELLFEGLNAADHRGDLSARCLALERLGVLELKDGDLDAAQAHILNWLQWCREAMPFAELACQVRLGEVLLAKGLLNAAQQCFVRGLAGSDSCLNSRSDAMTAALAERGLGDTDARIGHYSSAKSRLTNSLTFFERRQVPWGVVFAADSLGWASHLSGDPTGASALFHRVLRIALEWHWWPWALGALAGQAWVISQTENVERATQIAALVQAHPATEQWIRSERSAPLLASLAGALSPSVFQRAVEGGQMLELVATARAVLDGCFSPQVHLGT